MIEFGHPWMLVGLLGALVPVWLHMFGRRRAPVIHFSALDFVLATNPRKARALHVREWVLVAMRAGVMALVALALSRPMLPVLGGTDGVDVGSGVQAVVVLIDDSMSMGAKRQGGTVFDQARTRALRLLERLPSGSRAAVVATGFPARALTRQLTADRAAAMEALRRLQPQPRRDDASRAFVLAQALLDSATDLPTRRVALFSDLQAQGWQAAVAPTSTINGAPVLVTVDALRPDSLDNAAIVSAVVNTGQTDGAAATADRAGEQVRLDVSVAHHGAAPFRNYLTVRAGDRELKSLLQLKPGERAQRTFTLPPGTQWGEVLLPGDSLEADNRRLVRLDARPSIRVALVNGAPRSIPREDEVFFAARALEAVAGAASELAVDALPADKLTPAALANYDVVVLANLPEPSQQALEALVAAVRAGKGVLVTLGDNLPPRPEHYLEGLLPANVVGQRGGLAGAQGTQLRPVALQLQEPSAATAASAAVARLQRRLAGLAGEGLARVDVSQYALLQPSARLSAAAVVQFSDGAPALVLDQLGRGHVALWTTSLDRDWTDLPLHPGFPPLLYETIVALAGTQAVDRRDAVAVGEPSLLSRDDRADQMELRLDGGDAAGGRRVLSAALQRAGVWSLPGLDQPGRYAATELRGGVALGARPLVVTPPDGESDLSQAALGALVGVQPGPQRTSGLATAPGWTSLLVLLVLLLLVEAGVLARGAGQLRWPALERLRARWQRS